MEPIRSVPGWLFFFFLSDCVRVSLVFKCELQIMAGCICRHIDMDGALVNTLHQPSVLAACCLVKCYLYRSLLSVFSASRPAPHLWKSPFFFFKINNFINSSGHRNSCMDSTGVFMTRAMFSTQSVGWVGGVG